MKQILWFRRDLRVSDSAILSNAKDEVLPIFIFDKNILDKLSKDDKRVSFIYKSVLELKEKLKAINLDLAIFYGTPKEVFKKLKTKGFDSILCSVDFDDYAKKRDEEISKIIPIQTFTDSFIIHPNDCLKSDKTPYKVFTPFYKSLNYIWESEALEEYEVAKNLKKIEFDYDFIPSLTDLGFENQKQLEQFDKIASGTNYNGNTLLQKSSTDNSTSENYQYQAGLKGNDIIESSGIQSNTQGLGLSGLVNQDSSTFSSSDAKNFLEKVDSAINGLNDIRSNIGSVQNQLESSNRNLLTQQTSTLGANSLYDTDYAKESSNFSKQNILAQIGAFGTAQGSNINQQMVTRLLS